MARLGNSIIFTLNYEIAWFVARVRRFQRQRMQGVSRTIPLSASDHLRRMPEIIQHLVENLAPLYLRREQPLDVLHDENRRLVNRKYSQILLIEIDSMVVISNA